MSKPAIDITTLPQPPQGAVFSLDKVDTVSWPHPYCLTPRHVAWASDHFGGILGPEAILDAEKHGAQCDICRKRREHLTFDQHENNLTLFIYVPVGSTNLNAIPGLHSYLFENKAAFEKAGIKGFTFPPKRA